MGVAANPAFSCRKDLTRRRRALCRGLTYYLTFQCPRGHPTGDRRSPWYGEARRPRVADVSCLRGDWRKSGVRGPQAEETDCLPGGRHTLRPEPGRARRRDVGSPLPRHRGWQVGGNGLGTGKVARVRELKQHKIRTRIWRLFPPLQ